MGFACRFLQVGWSSEDNSWSLSSSGVYLPGAAPWNPKNPQNSPFRGGFGCRFPQSGSSHEDNSGFLNFSGVYFQVILKVFLCSVGGLQNPPNFENLGSKFFFTKFSFNSELFNFQKYGVLSNLLNFDFFPLVNSKIHRIFFFDSELFNSQKSILEDVQGAISTFLLTGSSKMTKNVPKIKVLDLVQNYTTSKY